MRASCRAWPTCSGALARITLRCVCGPESASVQPRASVIPTPCACGAQCSASHAQRCKRDKILFCGFMCAQGQDEPLDRLEQPKVAMYTGRGPGGRKPSACFAEHMLRIFLACGKQVEGALRRR